MKLSLPDTFSSRLALGLVVFNVSGAILVPIFLAAAGYLVGWVFGGILAGLLIVCPFVTFGIICRVEDYLCRWCYDPR